MMALGPRICAFIGQFVLNHTFLFIILTIVLFSGYDFYDRFYRINRDTDKIDLMKRYIYLEMRRRYK